MNKASIVLVVLPASMAFGSKVHKTKEPTAQLAENTLHVYRFQRQVPYDLVSGFESHTVMAVRLNQVIEIGGRVPSEVASSCASGSTSMLLMKYCAFPLGQPPGDLRN